MILAAILLLVQDPAGAEITRLLAGLETLLADAIKNADELDRRCVALTKLVEANPEARWRGAAMSWLPRLARKTGRAAQALAVVKEQLKSPPPDPRHVEGLYQEAIYTAALALKPDDVISLVRALAKERPDSSLGSMRESVEREARTLGRSAATVAAPLHDGSKPFSWSTETKDKLVVLYFTASW